MRLSAEELTKLGTTFTALQAVLVTGSPSSGARKIVVVKPDNSEVAYEDDALITLEPGDEIEVLPRAYCTDRAGNSVIES